MNSLLVLATVIMWSGATLVLGSFRRFRRPALIDRLRPYIPGTDIRREPEGSSIGAVLGPIASDLGATVARVAGVEEDLARRLERIHAPFDATSFRLRQLGWVIGSIAAATLLCAISVPPIPIALLLLAGTPTLAFLALESSLSKRSKAWKHRVLLELPVVSEQLGMLLSAGYSLGGALARLAERSDGAIARDLRRVVTRIGHGVDEHVALDEWAHVADVPAVHRLVGVLALDRDAGDLGRLITDEARATRAELHRNLVETIEKRTQQVWIPVTVATLVPGLLFLAVPFTEALQLFTSS